MQNSINEIKQIALKNRVITIGTFVIGVLLCVCVIVLHKPTIKLDETQVELLENKRSAIEKQNEALYKLSEEQSKSTRFFAERDSVLQIEIKLNRIAIEKIKIPNETIKRFNSYSSNDWTAYFAALPDEGQ